MHEAIEKLYQELLPTIGRAFDKLEVSYIFVPSFFESFV
jgi:hypothetical protein